MSIRKPTHSTAATATAVAKRGRSATREAANAQAERAFVTAFAQIPKRTDCIAGGVTAVVPTVSFAKRDNANSNARQDKSFATGHASIPKQTITTAERVVRLAKPHNAAKMPSASVLLDKRLAAQAASICKVAPYTADNATKPVTQANNVSRDNAKPTAPQDKTFVLENASTSKQTHPTAEPAEQRAEQDNCASTASASAVQVKPFARGRASFQSGIPRTAEPVEMPVVADNFVCKASVKAAPHKPPNVAQAVVPTNWRVATMLAPTPKTAPNIAEPAAKSAPQTKAVAVEHASPSKTTTNTAVLVGMCVALHNAAVERRAPTLRKIPKTAARVATNALREVLVATASAKTSKRTFKTAEPAECCVVEAVFAVVESVWISSKTTNTAVHAVVPAVQGKVAAAVCASIHKAMHKTAEAAEDFAQVNNNAVAETVQPPKTIPNTAGVVA